MHLAFEIDVSDASDQSKLFKTELATGKALQTLSIADTLFGEGITIYNNKLYQLTWQNHKVLVYDANTFKKEKELESKMKESQEKIKNIQVEGKSGSNSVKITLNGENEMIKIDLLVSSALDLRPDTTRIARAENFIEDGKLDTRRD